MYADAATSVCSCSLSTVDRRRLHCLIISRRASYIVCVAYLKHSSLLQPGSLPLPSFSIAFFCVFHLHLLIRHIHSHSFFATRRAAVKLQLQSSRVAVGDSRSSQDSLFSCVLLSSICSLTHSNKAAAAAAAATVKTD